MGNLKTGAPLLVKKTSAPPPTPSIVKTAYTATVKEPEAADFNDTTPADVVDADVPADIFYNSQEDMPPTAAPKIDNDLEYAAELTQADKIEAACSKVHPTVRAFIEEELRGRFVSVQKHAPVA